MAIGPNDYFVNQAQQNAQKDYERQRSGPAQFTYPDISASQGTRDLLLNALMGAGAGVTAANDIQNPFAAGLAGLAGGISAPRNQDLRARRQAAQNQLQEQQYSLAEQQLNATPVGQVSPGIVQALKDKYNMDVSEIPMGQFQKFSGLLQHSDDLEKQLFLLRARAGLADNKNNLTLEEAKLYQKSYKIPAEFLVGKDKGVVNQQVIGFRPFQKQAQALMQAQITINNLKGDWDKISNQVGVSGGVRGAIGKASGGLVGSPELAAYMKNRNSAITGIRKLFNDSGAPSNFDVDRYLDSIPSVYDQVPLANKQWDFLGRQNEMGKETIIQASPLTEYLFNKNAGQSVSTNTPKSYSQTATNPQTGQKIGLNASGQWEVIR